MALEIAKVVAGAVGPIMQGLDGLFTSDDERNKARLALDTGLSHAFGAVLAHQAEQEQARTERHKNDMNSDSFLSKNIRPITLVVLTALFIFLVVLDSMPADFATDADGAQIRGAGGILVEAAKFEVKERWITLLESLLIAVYGFYFVSRGVQASMQSYSKMKQTSQPELK